jgi:acid phosphatase
MRHFTTAFFVCLFSFTSCHKIIEKSGYQTTGPASGSVTLPRPGHIVIVVEENHGYSLVVGSDNAPYINELVKMGALFTNSHGIGHPSQPNYLVLFSGNIQGVKNDDCLQHNAPFTAANLGASLLQNSFTFKGYAQTMPSDGYKGCEYKISTLTNTYLYARKHVPWVNWLGNKTNDLPDSLSLPMSKFPADYNKLPTVSFVIPDMDNDMHNSGKLGANAAIKRGDTWLKDHLDHYIKWAQQHNSLFILTFDEDDFTKQNQIPTLFIGPMLKPGKYSEKINHYNVFNTIEAIYGLSADSSKNNTVIRDIWN